jgi:hypothetical protein
MFKIDTETSPATIYQFQRKIIQKLILRDADVIGAGP